MEISAGGVVYYQSKNKNKKSKTQILLIKDSYDRWALPKGHLEQKESIWKAALREVQEETGLKDLKIIRKINYTKYFFKEKGRLILKIVYLFLMQALDPILNIQKQEIHDAKWFNPQSAIEKTDYQNLKPIIKKAIKYINYKGVKNE